MKNIKLLIIDVDGTLTDGKIYFGKDGEIFKAFNVKDGTGIHDILPQYGIMPVVLTARRSEIVENRCKELEIQHLYQGCTKKKEKVIEIASQYGISLDEHGILQGIAYIGDDIVDIESMKIVEVSGCPKDASDLVKKIVNFISCFNGGNGAVREFIEWLIQK